MDTEKNMVKYETYKAMYEDLKRALKYGFYYQAIFIEYAIFEDRLSSLLIHANVPITNKNGKEDKISRKIGKVRSRPEFTTKFVRDRISLEMLDQISKWTEKRNGLIHGLANKPYDYAAVEEIAVEGNDLLKVFSTKVKSVNNYNKKKNIQN